MRQCRLTCTPVDAFTWEMQNRIGTKIYFDYDEIEMIRDYPQLMTSIRNFVQQYNRKPDGSSAFVLSFEDQQRYPRFTELVRNISIFVEQHERVKQALVRHTNLPYSKIKVLLKFGSGPKIVIRDLRPDFGEKAYGHTVHPGFPESRIEVQDSFVRGLEASTGAREATAFLLVVTLLHELTHYGAIDGGRIEVPQSDEFGADFEREVLGTKITKDNAGQLRVLFYKNN